MVIFNSFLYVYQRVTSYDPWDDPSNFFLNCPLKKWICQLFGWLFSMTNLTIPIQKGHLKYRISEKEAIE